MIFNQVANRCEMMSEVACVEIGLLAGHLTGRQRVPFIVAELGRDADTLMLHLYAALAKRSDG